MTRRTTYKIERIMNFGEGNVKLPILETNNKREFFEQQDEMITHFGAGSLVTATLRTATFQY